MHYGCLCLKTLFFLTLCFFQSATAVVAQTAPDGDFHISAIAEFFAIHKYPKLKANKVIVVGPGGYWGENSGIGSADRATKGTLAACNGMMRTAEVKALRSVKCVVFDINGKRTGKAAPVGIPFGTVAPGSDAPLEYGRTWEATRVKRRGTLLFLHGCAPVKVMNGWLWSWVNYYRAAGLRVVMPNSFAELRDPELCGWPGETGIDQQSRILKFRAAQTLRNIASLRKKYPGEPLYVHGHSEGGYVAQILGETVDGVIVTGSPCGFGSSKAYWVGKNVAILLIAGSKDPYFSQAVNAKELTRYCRNVVGDGKMSWVSVTGMGHYTAPWWSDVQDAVSKFFSIRPIKVGKPSSNDVAYPALPKNVLEQYQNAKGPKAIAASKTGIWDFSIGLESKLDAEEAALFGCDSSAGADAYLDASHLHECVLVDVNGRRLVQ